ncbi:MAG: calcium-binding protein [Cyanobacteriota bacterium]|nr:calcium-binding protein [Cyanobacteriota bacterium]
MTSILAPLGFVGFFGFPVLGGTENSDTVFLSPGEGASREILLLGGNDSLQAASINDPLLINGNRDSDTISGGTREDTIFGGADGDRIFSDFGRDEIFGNLGSDSIEGGFDGDAIYGGQGNDFLNGDEGDDSLFGDRGDDLIDGDAGIDDLIGGEGNDTFLFDPAEASRDINNVDAIFLGFEAGNSSSVGDKIAVPRNLRDQIDPISLERNIDADDDGDLDIALELFDGRFLGVIIDDGTLPDRLSFDIDFIFSDAFDFL